MKLLIDIPDSDYERIKDLVANDTRYTTATTIGTAYQVIANGLPYEDRPQGEWEVYGRQGGIPITDICTNCKYEMKWYRNKYNFCPNCGAKMLNGCISVFQ